MNQLDISLNMEHLTCSKFKSFFLLLFLLVTSFGFGQTNDNCSGAISLTPSADNTCNPTTGSTVGATQSQPGCTGTADDDVWYSFVATSTDHIITVTDGTLYDSVLQLFTGTCGSL